MAMGDADDMAARIRGVLPGSWFPVSGADNGRTPILNGVLAGLGAAWAQVYTLLSYAKRQTRIASSTDFFLDIVAADFFGGRLVRRVGEPDAAFRSRIQANLFAPRATRAAVSAALADLTGNAPAIFEPAYTHDTGGYGTPAQGGGNMGYGRAGGWGSLQLPFQFFIEAYRPLGNGIARVAGYGHLGDATAMPGAYGRGAIQFASNSQLGAQITDDEMNATIAAAVPAATIAWARILDPLILGPMGDGSGAILSDEGTDVLSAD